MRWGLPGAGPFSTGFFDQQGDNEDHNDDQRFFNLVDLSGIALGAEKQIKYPLSAKDAQGRLLCGAAIGITANCLERAEALVKAKVDVVVLDSAHGHSANVLRTVRMIKDAFPDLQVIAGNVATGEATKALIEAGVDAVKVDGERI